MRWGRKQGRPQQQSRKQQHSSCTRSSPKFSLSRALLHGGWMSKLKQSLVGKANATKLKQESTSEVDRHTFRVTTVSDRLSFNPRSLGHFIAGDDPVPPRHSYHGGEGEVPCFNCKRRGRRKERGGSFGFDCSEKESGYEPDHFPLFSSGRSDLLRSRSEKFVVNVPYNERSKIDGDLAWSKGAPELKPIQTRKYPDQDPVDLYRVRKRTTGKMRRKSNVRVNSPRLTVRKKVSKLEAPRSSSSSTRKTRLRKLESFAVAKCSVDPHKDFRDSMVEMILEKRMVHPEELEGLLACYLSLNSCEYHDIIVKVFRQVWFELNTKTVNTEKRCPNKIKRRSW